ncbi:hypothetical protein NSQ43_10240 [Sporosarcina sp. FSL W8-0480]|uniref:hypothetical protein n=1 Tax=Sporosarcina sp. FSL W8-0480 TaxID=2954701 RepID=UPI0030DBC103
MLNNGCPALKVSDSRSRKAVRRSRFPIRAQERLSRAQGSRFALKNSHLALKIFDSRSRKAVRRSRFPIRAQQ